MSAGEAYVLPYGSGILLSGADADALRELRRSYVAGEHGLWWYRFIPIVDDEGALHELSVRDTTLFENERGLIDWLHGDSPPPTAGLE